MVDNFKDESSGKKSKRPALIVGILCIGAVLAAIGYVMLSKNNNAGGGWKKGKGNQQAGAVSVKTQVATLETLHDYVQTNGEIETQSSIEVFPDIGGKIVTTYVTLGSTVRRGAVIAEIDPSEPGTQYAHSQVYAPISGTITQSPLKPGTTVKTTSTITIIGDVANLQISANIPERYVASLKTGLKANIELEAYKGEVFTATVTRVSPVVDSTSRTKEIILNFDKKDARINAGMFAKVTLYTEDYAGKVVLPSSCIISKNSKHYVYTLDAEGSKAKEVEVTLGNTVDNKTQILSGITEGDRVVVEGMRVLTDGALVKDISSLEKKSEGESL